MWIDRRFVLKMSDRTTHGCGDGWRYESVLPYFKKSEDQEGGDRALHGAGGPVSVSNARICESERRSERIATRLAG